MKKITLLEAEEFCTKDSYDYHSGYNTACELANTELEELKDKWGSENLDEIRYLNEQLTRLKETLIKVQLERDEWMNKHFKRLVEKKHIEKDCTNCHYLYSHKGYCDDCDDMYCKWQPDLSPEMKDLLSKPDLTDDIIQGLINRIEKLEQNAVMDGDAIKVNGVKGDYQITKLK